jgi:hypothetical protein
MAFNLDNSSFNDRDREIAAQPIAGSLVLGRVSVARWRARPDRDQRWIRLPIDRAEASELRRRAGTTGVTVDAWLGIAIGYEQVRAELAHVSLSEKVRRALPASPLDFGATEKVRAWQRYLLQADAPGLSDELPEVVLGGGISCATAARVLPAALRIPSDEWDLGRECELRAAAASLPLPDYIRALARS